MGMSEKQLSTRPSYRSVQNPVAPSLPHQIVVRPGRPQDPKWWAERLMTLAAAALPCGFLGLGVAGGTVFLFDAIYGPLVLGGVVALMCWLYVGSRIFHLTPERWTFGDGMLKITDANEESFRRDIPIARIRHLGMPTRHSIEIAIPDPERHTPEFLRLPVRTLHAEDIFDNIVDLLDEADTHHVHSIQQGDELSCRTHWTLQDDRRLTASTASANITEFSTRWVKVDAVRYPLRELPIQHVRDPDGRCRLLFRDRILFRFDGLAVGRIVTDINTYRLGRINVEFSNGENMCLDELAAQFVWNGEVLGTLDLRGNQRAIRAEKPLPHSWLLLAITTWTWIRPRFANALESPWRPRTTHRPVAR